jgi:hypothetical protein
MNRSDYKAYLASREWAVLKEQVRDRCAGMCERCFFGPYQETHHLTYERVGHERLEDLLAVCSACHEYVSAKRTHDPADLSPIAIRHRSTMPRPLGTPEFHGATPVCLFCRHGARDPRRSAESRALSATVPAAYDIYSASADIFMSLCQECLFELARTLEHIGRTSLDYEHRQAS